MYRAHRNNWSKANALPPVVCLVESKVNVRKKKRTTARYALEHNFPKFISELAGDRVLWAFDQTRDVAVKEELQSIFDRLSKLKKIEDVDDEYVLKPTPRAYKEFKLTIMETYDRMRDSFPMPRIVPDGEGGIVASWSQDGRRVRLRFRSVGERRDYIYYQSADDYDVESATTDNLTKRLKWLLGE